MKYTYMILCLLLAIGLLSADTDSDVGLYGYKFLNVPSGPISIGMASRGVHNSYNAAAFILQPAAACEADQRVITLTSSPWLADTQANCLAYSYAKRLSHFGIAFRNLDYGEIENRDDTGFLIGNYHPLDVDLLVNYSYRMSPYLYFGFNVGALYQKLNTATSLGAHGDFGFSIIPPLEGTKLSAAFRNIGQATKTNEYGVRFPTSIEADLSKQMPLGDNKLLLGLGYIKVAGEETKGSVSAELELFKLLSLRAGYKLNYAAEDLSAGFGIAYRRIRVDYGYAAFTDGLNDVHSFGLAYQF
ncbi:MAG: PorV/PorQ family protein [Candidatus Cloacimonetes bacterium]|nr:PorV/PorQ family protein [Candidatus Cloacimonadota bacterium]